MKILHLTLKRRWFDLILSGEKTEEYRELKEYWVNRLIDPHQSEDGNFEPHFVNFKHFDLIRFTNGYAKDAPTFDIECKGISIGTGKHEWGGEGQTFIISLGKIITNE